jgi:hypothetical protein
MSRRQTTRFQCGHEGCKEFAVYDYTYADERKRLWDANGNGKYRCSRHTRMDENLSADNTRTVYELTATKVAASSGGYLDELFWCVAGGRIGSGFMSGPGFKAFASDFPEGTVVRVTAEVVLPK